MLFYVFTHQQWLFRSYVEGCEKKAEALHSSLMLCRFGHADWKMVQCLKLSLEWLG